MNKKSFNTQAAVGTLMVFLLLVGLNFFRQPKPENQLASILNSQKKPSLSSLITEEPKYAPGVIVKLSEPAVARKLKNSFGSESVSKNQLASSQARSIVNQQQTKIKAEQDNFLGKVKTKIGETAVLQNTRTSRLSNTVFLPLLEYKPDNIEKLKEAGAVKVYPNLIYKVILDESVPLIQAYETWSLTDTNGVPLDGTGVKVAVIDTGVDYTHPDLGGCFGAGCKIVGGYDFFNNDSDPMDDHGHGTHVAATVAGVHPSLLGVAPGASIYALKVCSPGGSCPGQTMIDGVEWAADPNGDGDFSDRVDVISMSLGATCGEYSEICGPDDPLAQEIDQASLIGVISSISAGNSGPTPSTVGTPAIARTAIAVAAACKPGDVGTNSSCPDPIANFSSRGPAIYNGENLHKPDIAAPGVRICAAQWSLWLEDSHSCGPTNENHIAISGTSMAAPHVGGALAILRQAFPLISPETAKASLQETALDLGGGMTEDEQGAGLIQIKDALLLIDPSLGGTHLLNIVPGLGFVTATGTTSFFSGRANYQVTNIHNVPVSLSPTFDLPPGVSFELSPSSFSLSPGQTIDVELNYSINRNTAFVGPHQRGSVFYSVDGHPHSFSLFFNIPPTLVVQTSAVFPSLPKEGDFFSNTIEVSVSNLRTDISQTVSLSSSCCDQEVNGISFSHVPEIVVPPGGTLAVPITVIATNLENIPIQSFYATLNYSTPTQPQGLITNLTIHHLPALRIQTSDAKLLNQYVELSFRSQGGIPPVNVPYGGAGSVAYIDSSGNVSFPLAWPFPESNYDIILTGPVFFSVLPQYIYPDTYVFLRTDVDFSSSWDHLVELNTDTTTKEFSLKKDPSFISSDASAKLVLWERHPNPSNDRQSVVSFPISYGNDNSPSGQGFFGTKWHLEDFGGEWKTMFFGKVTRINYNEGEIEAIPFSQNIPPSAHGDLSLELRLEDLKTFNLDLATDSNTELSSEFSVEGYWCLLADEGSTNGYSGEYRHFVNFVVPWSYDSRCLQLEKSSLSNESGIQRHSFNYFPGNYNIAPDSFYDFFPYVRFEVIDAARREPEPCVGGTGLDQCLSLPPDLFRTANYFLANNGIVKFSPVYGGKDGGSIGLGFVTPENYDYENVLANTILETTPHGESVSSGLTPNFFKGNVSYFNANNLFAHVYLTPHQGPSYWNSSSGATFYGPWPDSKLSYRLYRDSQLIEDSTYYSDTVPDYDDYQLNPNVFGPASLKLKGTAPGGSMNFSEQHQFKVELPFARSVGEDEISSLATLEVIKNGCSGSGMPVCNNINPPVLNNLSVVVNEQPRSNFDPGSNNVLRGEILPGNTCYRASLGFISAPVCHHPDEIATAFFEYKPTSQGNYLPLVAAVSGDPGIKQQFEVSIPVIIGVPKYDIRLTLADTSGNRLIYETQVPVSRCGDNIISFTEVCDCGEDGVCGNDDDNVADQSCGSQGFESGVLTCSNSCQSFSPAQCQVPLGCGPGHQQNLDGTCTAIFSADPEDAHLGITSNVLSWEDLRQGTQATTKETNHDVLNVTNNHEPGDLELIRSVLPFDTSSIPNSSEILSAILKMVQYAPSVVLPTGFQDDFLTVVKVNQQNPPAVLNSDYGFFGSLEAVDQQDRFDIDQNYSTTNFNLPFNTTGRSFINKDGWTSLGLRMGPDLTGNIAQTGQTLVGSSVNSANWPNSSLNPKLEVKYEAAASWQCSTGQYGTDYQQGSEFNPINFCTDGYDNDCDGVSDTGDSECPAIQCNTPADEAPIGNCDGCVDLPEITAYTDGWYNDLITIDDLAAAMDGYYSCH